MPCQDCLSQKIVNTRVRNFWRVKVSNFVVSGMIEVIELTVTKVQEFCLQEFTTIELNCTATTTHEYSSS